MILTFAAFGGIAPRIDPTHLPENGAQIAKNCRLQSGGPVEPMYGTTKVYPASGVIAGGVVQSIYRFKRATPSDTEWWFAAASDSDYASGMIAGDTGERTLYSSSAHEPRYTYSPIAEAGGVGPFPVSYYKLGVPAPTAAPAVSKTGTPDVGATPDTRFYVYTFVTSDGQESAPSPVSVSIERSSGETVLVSTLQTFPAGNYDFVSGRIRIYKTVSGSTAAGFFFAKEMTAAQLVSAGYQWSDTEPSVGEELPTDGWVPPPATLRGMVAMPNGVVAGFTGNDVYFCEPFVTYAYPVRYVQTFHLPVVGLGVFGSSLAVLTTGEPYVLSGSDPGLMSQQMLALPQACVSKRSIKTVGNAVIYASPDGLVSISDAGVDLITAKHFGRREWQALNPSSMMGATYDGLYIAFYDAGNGNKGGIVFDPKNGAITTTDLFATAAFGDSITDALYLCMSQEIHKFDSGSALTMQWKSGKRAIRKPGSFAWGQVIAASYPVSFKLWADGTQAGGAMSVGSAAPFRLPVAYGRFWEIEFAAPGRVFVAHLANEARELASI